MKKTEYFMIQVGYSNWQNGLDQVRKLRDSFINSTKIEKIIGEDLIVTSVAANQTNFTIKLSYY